MLTKENKPRYTIPHRLSDVIALISVLSQHKQAFMSEEMLNDALRGIPRSKATIDSTDSLTWSQIVDNHHEFFRQNGNKLYYALVIRSYFEQFQDPDFPNDAGKMLRPTLTVDETQNLIDVAITLHDKEVERLKKSDRWFPLIVAAIALLGLVFNTVYTNKGNSDTAKQIDSLKTIIKQVNTKIDKSFLPKPDNAKVVHDNNR